MEILDLAKSAGILDLKKAAPSLKKLKGILEWDEHPLHPNSLSEGFDLDLFVFSLNQNGKISGNADVCYYNNKFIHENSISIPVDNRTGQGEDDEYVLMDLEKIPTNIQALDLYSFVYEAEKRSHHFGMISNAKFSLYNGETDELIQAYNLSQFVGQTGLHAGRVQRTADGWEFAPVGVAGTLTANQVAGSYM
jgi:tellurium resistance protein TerD